jgi:hypothetical protein
MITLRNLILAFAALAVSSVPCAKASDISITLDFATLSGAPGDTVTFSGFLTNLDNAVVDLTSCGPTMLGLFVVDCTPFLINAPLFLDPNEVTPSFDMFTVTIQTPFTDPFTFYPGVFEVQGSVEGPGGPGSGDPTVLGSTPFNVQVVPEPATIGMIGVSALLGFLRVRRLTA